MTSTRSAKLLGNSARAGKTIAAWLIFLTATFGFGWYMTSENQRYHREVAEWNKAQSEFVTHCKAEVDRIRGQVHLLQGRPGSQNQLEQQINRGKPFALRDRGKREIARWDDPDIGYGGQLEFENGVLVGWRLSGPSIGNFALRNPAPIGVIKLPAEKWRRWIARLGFNIWLIALVAWFALPRRRLVVAQVLMAAALASGMAWLVNPGYTISWRGVLSNDSLALAALMIAIGVYVLAVTVAGLPNSTIARPRFRLSHLLLLVTLVAALLAVGPFGYVTLLVGVSGAGLFALVYYLYRLRRAEPIQTGMDAV